MSSILVTGANGQLGRCLQSILPNATYVTRGDLNLADAKSIDSFFKTRGRFDTIINLAAYTLVDKAETEKDLAAHINSVAPGTLATHAQRFIHVSTDYVFSGESKVPYKESDPTAPINHYGLTKRQGEVSAFKANPNTVVIRTSWLYSSNPGNFVTKMLELAKTRDELKIVNDQTGSPTHALDLAHVIVGFLQKPTLKGTYHYSNEGQCTWYEFAREIFTLANIGIRVLPIPSSEFPTPAKRPQFSLLDKSKIKKDLDLQIPHWQQSLKNCMESL
jgi:dTDP-4-dehydrorhamnose reductase